MKHLRTFALALVLVMCMVVPAFAAPNASDYTGTYSTAPFTVNGVDYPILYRNSTNVYHMIEWYEQNASTKPDAIWVLHVDSTDTYLFRYNGGAEISGNNLVSKTASSFDMYKLTRDDNNERIWSYYTSSNSDVGGHYITEKKEVKAVSRNLYDNTGTLVLAQHPSFHRSLPEEIQAVTEGTLEGALPGMDGTMRVLVPCGVGLMALLVVLKLFCKRSLIFLRR